MATSSPKVTLTSIGKIACPYCNVLFKKRNTLNKHVVRKHPSERTIKAPFRAHSCPLCKYSSNKQLLLDHFYHIHNIDIEIERHTFSNYEELEVWKEDLEHQTKSRFRVRSSNATSDSDTLRKEFLCHRSGIYSQNPSVKGLRKTKYQGSVKINGFCPAEIICTSAKDTETWEVKFVKTHVGHQHDVEHLTLTTSERKSLANKIASKIPFSAILDEVQENITSDKEDLEKMHLLTMNDLYNIEKGLNLNSSAEKHLVDAKVVSKSIDVWVHEMERPNGRASCVILYKQRDVIHKDFPELKAEDFVLAIMNSAQTEILQKFSTNCICVDWNDGASSYGLQLTTLLVVDDLRQGFPCAFLISSSEPELTVLKAFFTGIRNRVGTLYPKVFMSDISNSYIDAWADIMSPPSLRLFCNWHVDGAWREMIGTITDKALREEVYLNVRTLLEEQDGANFAILRQNVEKMLLGDNPETHSFGKYFFENFLNCVDSWTCFHPLHPGVSTCTNIERIHNSIKFIFLKGKSAKSLEKCMSALMKFVWDKSITRLITLSKGKVTYKLKELRKRHRDSEVCKLADTVCQVEGGWAVRPSNTRRTFYVNRESQDCQCQLRCPDCNVCIHSYTCSCNDSAIRWNMCKHIHGVCTFLRQSVDESPVTYESEEEVMEEAVVDLGGTLFYPAMEEEEEEEEEVEQCLDPRVIIEDLRPQVPKVSCERLNILNQRWLERAGTFSSLSCDQVSLVEKMLNSLDLQLEAMTELANETLPAFDVGDSLPVENEHSSKDIIFVNEIVDSTLSTIAAGGEALSIQEEQTGHELAFLQQTANVTSTTVTTENGVLEIRDNQIIMIIKKITM